MALEHPTRDDMELAAVLHALSDPQRLRIVRILAVTGFVASAPGFEQQPAVVDGASHVLHEVFGDAGRHTRSAIGVAALPRRGAVEIEVTAAVSS